MFPFLYGLAFTFHWFVSNLGLGTGSGTSEVAPSTGDSHCFLEACLEDGPVGAIGVKTRFQRSEEHTSELQSPDHLVCRLLLEKKKHKTSTRVSANLIA